MTPDVAAIARAAEILQAGGLVAFPTETVYGLGADARSTTAVARLFAVKGRPTDHPVIVHVDSAESVEELVETMPSSARALAGACWPGPLTLVLRRSPGPGGVVDAVTSGLATVGIRVPAEPTALALLHAFGGPVAAPSANRFGRVSPTTAADVRADLGPDVDAVLDGGPCRLGVESTIVDCSGDEIAILRVGGVPQARVEQIVGAPVARTDHGEVRAPGTLPSHYAPRARVLVADDADLLVARANHEATCQTRVGVIALGGSRPPGLASDVVVLGVAHDADEYARSLYRWLRAADAVPVEMVLAQRPDGQGIGAAVADRLERAAGARGDG